jgi:hypothetical protein
MEKRSHPRICVICRIGADLSHCGIVPLVTERGEFRAIINHQGCPYFYLPRELPDGGVTSRGSWWRSTPIARQ